MREVILLPLALASGIGLAGMLYGCNNSEEVEIGPVDCYPQASILPEETVPDIPVDSLTATAKTTASKVSHVDPLEKKLTLFLQKNPDHEHKDFLQRVVKNKDAIRKYSELSGFPSLLIAAHLEIETTFDPYRKSVADAYGKGQVRKIAYEQTMYTLAQVPGGFRNGKPKVSSLDVDVLNRQDLFKAHQQAFAELDPTVYQLLDEVFASYNFSLSDYINSREDRTQEFTELGAEYDSLEDKFKHRERCREILKRRKDLMKSQEVDNLILKNAVDAFWNSEVVQNGKPIKNRSGIVLWYQLNPDELPEGFVAKLDLLWSLNMKREYCQHEQVRTDITDGNIDLNAGHFQTAILGYNPDLEYLEDIQGTYAVVDSVLGNDL